jgi:hypothetical protein
MPSLSRTCRAVNPPADPDESFDWMIGFIDRGLRGSH